MARRLSLLAVLLIPALAWAQSSAEALKGADRTTFESMKRFEVKLDDTNKAILKKQAKYVVAQLTDPKRVEFTSDLVREVINDLPWIKAAIVNRPRPTTADQFTLGAAYGQALREELTPVLKNSGALQVRINAARMLAVLAQAGYAPVTELALDILADKTRSEPENDAVKFYALQTLHHALAFVPEPTIPTLSAFMKSPTQPNDYRELERRCIGALCDYVLKERDIKGKSEEEVAAMRYLRREAVRALGHARHSRVIYQEKVLSRPSYVLLKVANRDGLVPEPDMKEQALAIIGFGHLFPILSTADRAINCDYAAYALSAATYDIMRRKMNAPNAPETKLVPWVYTAWLIDDSLDRWAKNSAAMSLPNAASAKIAYDKVKAELLEPLKSTPPGDPNVGPFLAWLQANPPKSTSMFNDDEKSKIAFAGLIGSGN